MTAVINISVDHKFRPLLSRVVSTINLEYGRLYTVLYCNVLYSTVVYCTVLYRTIMYRTVLYYNKKVRNFQIRRAGTSYCNKITLVHRYPFSQRFYEPQRPYTATKKLENLPTDRQRTDRQR